MSGHVAKLTRSINIYVLLMISYISYILGTHICRIIFTTVIKCCVHATSEAFTTVITVHVTSKAFTTVITVYM